MTPVQDCSLRSAQPQIGPLIEVVAKLDGLGELDLAPARVQGDTELVGVVPAAQVGRPLLGLRGITSHAGREAKLEPETMLRTDTALEVFARLASPTSAAVPVCRSLRRPRARGARTGWAAEHWSGSDTYRDLRQQGLRGVDSS